MVAPANCSTCLTDTPSPGADHQANFGVVMGVLGAMVLVGLLVLITVPMVRYRKRRGLLRTATSKGEADVESARLQSRRSSLRHQKMSMPSGPDALLPLIDAVSTFTWSDLRSKNASVDSIATSSFNTNHATTSHHTPGMPSSADPEEMSEDVLDAAVSRMSLSSPTRSPTPPGLTSVVDASTAATPAGSQPYTSASPPTIETRYPLSNPMYPLTPVSPTVNTTDAVRNSSRARAQRPGMEPVLEDGADRGSHPRQLPSPPASPDQFLAHWQSRRRTGLAGGQSSSTALPFRPRSSTVSAPPPPLTSASQVSMRPTTSQLSTAPSATQRYHSIVTSGVASRPRSGSSSGSVHGNSPLQPDRDRSVDAFRRMSATDVRPRQPLSAESSTPRAYLRPSGVQHTPQLQEAIPSSHSHVEMRGRAATVTTPLYAPLSPLSPASPAGCSPRTQPSNIIWKQSSQARSHKPQPTLVPRKDSLALRPLPTSAFVMSPPHTRHSRTPSDTSTSLRTRSHSVMSQRSLPAHIPPLDPLPPIHFEHKFSPDDKSCGQSSQDRPAS